MNFNLLFKYFGMIAEILTSLETVDAQISAGQPAATMPFLTYVHGMHGAVSIVWTPISQPVVPPKPTLAQAAEVVAEPVVPEPAPAKTEPSSTTYKAL